MPNDLQAQRNRLDIKIDSRRGAGLDLTYRIKAKVVMPAQAGMTTMEGENAIGFWRSDVSEQPLPIINNRRS